MTHHLKYVQCNGLAPFVRLGPLQTLEVDQVTTPNVTPSMLRGEAHPLLYVAVHSDEMESMIKDRNGTVQASGLDSVCSSSQYKLEAKTTKLGKPQNVLAT